MQTAGSVAIDSTAVYTPATVDLSDGLVHTMSEYVTAVQVLGTGNKPLQIGWLAPGSTGFNAGFNFISARILGNRSAEFQYANGGGAVASQNTLPTGTINVGDWLKLTFTTQETASGSFTGTFSLVDYGPTGVGTATTVIAPVSYSISGLTGMGTASAVSPGFRTALPASFTGHVRFDNFSDPTSPPVGLPVIPPAVAGITAAGINPATALALAQPAPIARPASGPALSPVSVFVDANAAGRQVNQATQDPAHSALLVGAAGDDAADTGDDQLDSPNEGAM